MTFPPGSLHTLSSALLATGMLLSLNGCAPKEKAVVPPVDVPAHFSASGSYPLPDQWWRSFGDPSLNRLEERAMAGNMDLKTAWDRLAQARAAVRREGAALWPTAEIRGSQARTREVEVQRNTGGGGGGGGESVAVPGADGELVENPGNGGNGGGGTQRIVTYRSDLSLSLGVSYELDLWGRIRSIRDAARFDAKATAEELHVAAMTLSASVATTWYRLMEQYGQIALLNEQRELNDRILQSVTTRFTQGQVGAADVLQQRQLVEASQGSVALAEAQAAVLEHQLAILLGEPPTRQLAAKRTGLIDLPPLPATGLPIGLIERRPDTRRSYYNILAADRRLWAAKADRLPRLSLSADLNTSGPQVRDLFNNWLATIGSNLVAPLLDGGLRAAEVARVRAVLSERIHSYGQTILVALGEVEDALVRERKQRQFIASLAQQITYARTALERTRATYIQGQADYIRVLNAISTLQSLERNYLTARRELIEYRIELCRALGGGWDMKTPPLAPLLTRN